MAITSVNRNHCCEYNVYCSSTARISITDWNKKTFVERFAQSVAHHGPSLITLTKGEQGDGEGTMMDFLSVQTAGNQGWNYLKNVLQVSKT